MPDNASQPESHGQGLTGIAAPARLRGINRIGIAALILTVLWLGLSGLYVLVLLPDESADGRAPGTFLLTLLAVVLPVSLVWVAAASAQAAQNLRAETLRLQAAVDQLALMIRADRHAARMAVLAVGPLADTLQQGGPKPDPVDETERNRADSAPRDEMQPFDVMTGGLGLPEFGKAGRSAELPLGAFTTSREGAKRRGPPGAQAVEDQPSLELGGMGEDAGPPLGRADLIRALNFPETDKDQDGFAALRRALRDRQTRQLIQASQDVLTLLSQDGIYMDDLYPDRARPEIWRRFAQGERGRAVAALGGVRDRACLARTMARMRQDTVFRDAAHHFLRLFDRMLAVMEPEASDEDIARLAETRTARAFMLIGRVMGAFD